MYLLVYSANAQKVADKVRPKKNETNKIIKLEEASAICYQLSPTN